MNYRTVIAMLALVTLPACASKQDALNQEPMLDEAFTGDYETVATCTLHAIQSTDYTFQPNVQYLPMPGGVEVHTTASSGMTGVVYGAVTQFEDIDGASFQARVYAPYRIDGEVAVDAVRGCAEDPV